MSVFLLRQGSFSSMLGALVVKSHEELSNLASMALNFLSACGAL